MHYTLEIGDNILITTLDEKVYQAKLIDNTHDQLFINLVSFGKISINWDSVYTVHKIIEPIRKKRSFSPRYKVLVWQLDNSELQAC